MLGPEYLSPTRGRRAALTGIALAAVGACALILIAVQIFRVHCEVLTHNVLADGRFHAVARLGRSAGTGVDPGLLVVSGVETRQLLIDSDQSGVLNVLYRAPVKGGRAQLRLRYGSGSWFMDLNSSADWADRAGDGLPESLRLHDPKDRLRFRRWFTAMADRAAAVPADLLPPEITDCSSLLRYSFRIALLQHDGRWYKQFVPGTMPVLPSVEQWNYPDSLLGAALFRVTPPKGTPQPADFAEFADAKTLLSRNSYRVGRDVRAARPGDLLFFHQLEHGAQYHSMIVTGDGDSTWVVYHTGPDSARGSHGEMRRARLADLLHHPDPRWHPTEDNLNFLGVYRWNLLRED